MKSKLFSKLVAGLFLVGLLMGALAMVNATVAAAPVAVPAMQEGITLPPDVLQVTLVVMVGFASLYGVSKLIAALINVLKMIGVVKDGTSAQWAAGLNLAAFIALVVLGVFRPDVTTEILDGYAGQIASALLFVLGFVAQIAGSKKAHEELSGAKVPLIGTSFSKDA